MFLRKNLYPLVIFQAMGGGGVWTRCPTISGSAHDVSLFLHKNIIQSFIRTFLAQHLFYGDIRKIVHMYLNYHQIPETEPYLRHIHTF